MGKKIIIILASIVAILCVGIAGNSDADEYIEVNSKPVTHWER
jgi:hypothetical protein